MLYGKEQLMQALGSQIAEYGLVASRAGFRLSHQGDDADIFGVGKQKVNEKSRSVSGVANVLEISRGSNFGLPLRVDIKNMDTQGYAANPVVLVCHQQMCPGTLMPAAIATIEKVSKANSGQELRFRNMVFDTDQLSEAWYQKVLKGIVRMVSIGFLPTKVEYMVETVGSGAKKTEFGFLDIQESELLEISVVPVGANRGAFIDNVAQINDRLSKAEEQTAKLQAALDRLIEENSAKAVAVRDRLLSAIEVSC